jgi:hypothetical protein
MLEYDSSRLWVHPTILRTMCKYRDWLMVGRNYTTTQPFIHAVARHNLHYSTTNQNCLRAFENLSTGDDFASCALSIFLVST